MSANRPGRAPAWPRVAVVAAVTVIALALVLLAVRLVSGSLLALRSDGGETVPDPQFAEPAELVTRPPELDEPQGDSAPVDDDPSAHWDLGEQTPVDRTAEELSREAMAAS